jgi:hypothetical protein
MRLLAKLLALSHLTHRSLRKVNREIITSKNYNITVTGVYSQSAKAQLFTWADAQTEPSVHWIWIRRTLFFRWKEPYKSDQGFRGQYRPSDSLAHVKPKVDTIPTTGKHTAQRYKPVAPTTL